MIDRETDKRTPGGNDMSHDPEGGKHNSVIALCKFEHRKPVSQILLQLGALNKLE